MPKVTAENLTDEMIFALKVGAFGDSSEPWEAWRADAYRECVIALHDKPYASDYPTSTRRMLARARIAALLNARNKETP